MAPDLRAAAASARAFADNVGSAELRQSFRAIARRWEAEAALCEADDVNHGAMPIYPGFSSLASSKMKDQ